MFGLAESQLTAIATQGTGYALFVISLVVLYFMDKRYLALQKSCSDERTAAEIAVKAQYEKRLEEFREILDVMTRNTSAVSALQGSVDARTETLNQLTTGIAKLSHEFENMQQKWDDRGGGMVRQLEDVQRRLENLQGSVRA